MSGVHRAQVEFIKVFPLVFLCFMACPNCGCVGHGPPLATWGPGSMDWICVSCWGCQWRVGHVQCRDVGRLAHVAWIKLHATKHIYTLTISLHWKNVLLYLLSRCYSHRNAKTSQARIHLHTCPGLGCHKGWPLMMASRNSCRWCLADIESGPWSTPSVQIPCVFNCLVRLCAVANDVRCQNMF